MYLYQINRQVYILPLRNENRERIWRSHSRFWGLYPTFKEWKLICRSCHTFTPFVYILPLRNENSSSSTGLTDDSCLYPTFKEWKRTNIDILNYLIIVYILPLRNENLLTLILKWLSDLCLYPTFKEWKQCLNLGSSSNSNFVYILPLRNENLNLNLSIKH